MCSTGACPDCAWDNALDLGMNQVRGMRQRLEALLSAWLSRGQNGPALELTRALEEVEQLCERCGAVVPPNRRWPSYAHPTCYACLPPPPELPTVESVQTVDMNPAELEAFVGLCAANLEARLEAKPTK